MNSWIIDIDNLETCDFDPSIENNFVLKENSFSITVLESEIDFFLKRLNKNSNLLIVHLGAKYYNICVSNYSINRNCNQITVNCVNCEQGFVRSEVFRNIYQSIKRRIKLNNILK